VPNQKGPSNGKHTQYGNSDRHIAGVPRDPLSIYFEAVETGKLPPPEVRPAKSIGRIGVEFDVETDRRAPLNVLAGARQHWVHSTR
jgi:hypothetical protein